jgi:hypothetical protein
MCMSSPSIPAPAPPKEYAQTKDATAAVTAARDDQKERAAAAMGQQGSVQTSPFGVTDQATTSKNSTLGAK